MSELQPWLDRILSAQSIEEIFAILDDFRPLVWTDEDRASMAKIYNAKLNQLNIGSEKVPEKAIKSKTSSNISKQEAGNQRGESTSSTQELDEDEISL